MPLDLQALSDENPLHRILSVKMDRSSDGVCMDSDIGDDYVVDRETGAVHGGIVATLLDVACTFALIARTDHDWVTVDMRVDYLRPTRAGKVRLKGEVVRAGRAIGRSRAELSDASGTTCALAMATFAPSAPREGQSGST
ncbi:MAG TPA: PaaI family thioesterase [Chloroflexota bacterium]|jgi:uncharacterized protein (TIGR00369 family)|nr:PaaI family thioesterase [Chloroflexota bacterium]